MVQKSLVGTRPDNSGEESYAKTLKESRTCANLGKEKGDKLILLKGKLDMKSKEQPVQGLSSPPKTLTPLEKYRQ